MIKKQYFAYVNVFDDGVYGFWNETKDAGHAHSSLGKLSRDDACWVNDIARICAWK